MERTELPDGRGVGVAIERRTGSFDDVVTNGVVELQVIIDPATGAMISKRDVMLEPGTEERSVPVGTVVSSDTIEQAGWVNTDPVLPPGFDLDELLELGR